MREWHDHFEVSRNMLTPGSPSKLIPCQIEQKEEYVHIHTPIMTSSDCEGAGEAFRITTDPITPPSAPSTQKHDPFFPSPAYLTVSSQLHLEAPTHALSRTYTLSPTFRAEPSATSRHLAEFYMLEAELAFVETLDDLMDTLETAIKDVLGGRRMTRARRDQEVIAKSLIEDKAETPANEETDLIEQSDMFGRISGNEPFGRVTYTEAVEILKKKHAQTPFDFPPTWGAGLQSEHEKYLAGQVYRRPVFVTDYPRDLKPFYMRLNPKDHLDRETVACFDLLVPGIGELAGGSLREERLDRLIESIDKANMKREDYEWYLDLRRYGSVKHGGWGMGFDRFMCWLTGIGNVRDVVAFPRWKGHCKY
jgi:asparaginyl-tRNA synthetase